MVLKITHNGTQINIPDEEIARNMRALELTKEEAIQLYLDDLETTDKKTPNAEAEALTKKAKESGVQRQMCSTGVIAKSNKKRERPPDVDKIDLINAIKDYLVTGGYDNVEVINPAKLIEFNLGENRYAVDLIRRNKNLAAKKAAKAKANSK